MARLRGVPGGGGSASRQALALGVARATLALALGACRGDRIVIGGQVPPRLSELAGPGADAGSDAGRSDPGPGTPARCPDSPDERRELLGCWPTRQVGLWRGYWLGVPRYETSDGMGAEFPLGDVVMRFRDDGSGTLSVGASSASSPGACGPGTDAGPCAAVGELLAGFEYALDQVRLEDAGERGTPRVAGETPPRAGELMRFEIRLGQPWDTRCVEQAPSPCQGGVCPASQAGRRSSAAGGSAELGLDEPSCRCIADRCTAEAPSLPIALTMSEDGLALRGAYRPRDVRLPVVGLELSRVGDP